MIATQKIVALFKRISDECMVARLGSAIAFAEGSDEQEWIAQEQADKLFWDR